MDLTQHIIVESDGTVYFVHPDSGECLTLADLRRYTFNRRDWFASGYTNRDLFLGLATLRAHARGN